MLSFEHIFSDGMRYATMNARPTVSSQLPCEASDKVLTASLVPMRVPEACRF